MESVRKRLQIPQSVRQTLDCKRKPHTACNDTENKHTVARVDASIPLLPVVWERSICQSSGATRGPSVWFCCTFRTSTRQSRQSDLTLKNVSWSAQGSRKKDVKDKEQAEVSLTQERRWEPDQQTRPASLKKQDCAEY